MDYLKVHCFQCKGKFELYSRNMNHDDMPPMCPHCLTRMGKKQWERLIDAYYTFQEVNMDFSKYHEDRGEPLFQVEIRNHYVKPGKIVLNDQIIKNMDTMADIVKHPVPNRNIEDFE